jgi:rare lipoprotein A (peptidoglycan hydrolase)
LFIAGRVLDVSPRAARKLDFHAQGLSEVRLEVLSVGDGPWRRKPRRKRLFGWF